MMQPDARFAKILIRDLPIRHEVTKVEFLDKGYSTDRKYLLWTGDRIAYLLRVSDISEEQKRRSDYDLTARLHEKGIACPRPIAFGTNEDAGACFIVQSYVAGECAEDAIPLLTPDHQYDVGLDAGETLRGIHGALPSPHRVDDYNIRSGKYRLRREVVTEMGASFQGQDRAERYVEARMHLLRDRPTMFRHGDYHPGNLVLLDGRLAGVIDFNRCDWGDPIDDFYKMAFFGAPLSEPFARGQVRGYFGGDPPGDFWPLYNLYVAMVLPGDIAWTHKYYPQHFNRSIELIKLITRTHDFFSGTPPVWWQEH